MHWLDTLLLALLAVGGVLGFFTGLLWQIARILTLGIAVLATALCNDSVTRMCRDHLLLDADPRIAQWVAYVAVFLAVYIVLFLATRLLHAGIRATELEGMDRLLGAMFGAAKMAIILGGCCLTAINYGQATTRAWLEKSTLATSLADAAEHAVTVIPDEYKENLRDTLISLRDWWSRSNHEARSTALEQRS